jgi:hypothetical protein
MVRRADERPDSGSLALGKFLRGGDWCPTAVWKDAAVRDGVEEETA